MSGVDLRLGGAVVEAADLLARELGGADASVEHVPAKGNKEEKFIVTMVVVGADDKDSGHVSVDLPAAVADVFATRMTELANDASNYRRGGIGDVKDSDVISSSVSKIAGVGGG